MSYLNPLRLHFAGKFQAAPSTVNNDPTHFDNTAFKPQYQQLQTDDQHWNGWWNPRGDAAWRLIGCKVTSAWQADGSPADPSDMILTCLIADSERQVPAKIVDLDPEQQLVSAIWGLEVRICDTSGNTLLRAQFTTASFMDIWDRAQSSSGGDADAGAIYQSTLTNLEWGAIEQSPFLMALQAAAQDGLLSIKFNVDAYNLAFGSPDFTTGRIVGTIGPASASEPTFFTVGRQLMAVGLPPSPKINFFAPAGQINFCTGVVDPGRGKILIDLGNALPTIYQDDQILLVDLGTLSLAYAQQSPGGGTVQWVPVDTIPYTGNEWYQKTAGVVELPADRSLTSEELESIQMNPLALLLPGAGGDPTPAITEAASGLHVRPNKFVFYMSPGDQVDVQFYATRFGQPCEGVQIDLRYYPDQLQVQSIAPPPLGETWPDPGTPTSAVEFPDSVITGTDGIAVVPLQAFDPGNRRRYIDGQVYGVRAVPAEMINDKTYALNPWNFVSLLIWDGFAPDDPPTWWSEPSTRERGLQPIFQQYANLYPVMDSFLDLSNYESVCDNLELLRLVFGLDLDNPNSMPVTRDLSLAKRAAILQWLQNMGPDGKPLLGTPPSMQMSTEAEPEGVVAGPSIRNAHLGGKAAAASRRLVLRASRTK